MNKVLFFINDLRSGGAEKNLAFVANGFSNEFETVVVCYDHSEQSSFFKLNDRVKKISLKMHFEKLRSITNKEEKKEYIKLQAQEIEEVIKNENPDISIAFLPNMCMLVSDACEKLGKKCIVCARNDPEKELNSEAGRKKRDEVFEKSAGCVFQTEEIKKYFNQVTQQHSIIIPNPVMISSSNTLTNVKRNAIVSVGKYSSQKNQKMLLEAFERISKDFPDFVLEIYGKDYGEKANLINFAISLGIKDKVFFENEKPNIHQLISEAKIFVLTSDYEGMPNALAEAVALGIPSISTDCPFGGPRSVLDNGNRGVLIPVGDVDALYLSMRNLIVDESLRKKYSVQGKRILNERSPEIILKMWTKYVLELINRDDITRT